MRSVWQDRAVSLVGAFVILCAVSPVQAQLGDPFETAAPSLAIVTTHSGTGSGFILEMDEKKYLITNEHVLRGGKPVTARLLSGDRLVFSTLEVADQCDLVRLLLIDQTVAGLQMAIDQPTIGDAVSVFGNSEGSGVVTAISGKILGIGPDRIEVDAAFVRGNSGSPILLQDGTVLAVATYVERGAHASDWIKSGTRFTKPRRFGMKLDNVEWIVLSEDDYFVRADALTDLHTYCIDVYDLLQADVYDTGNRYQAFSYSIEKNRSKFRRNHKFAQLLADAADAISFYAYHKVNAEYYNAKSFRSRRAQEQINAGRQAYMSRARARAQYKKADAAWNNLRDTPVGWIRQTKWSTANFEKEASFWADVLIEITRRDKK